MIPVQYLGGPVDGRIIDSPELDNLPKVLNVRTSPNEGRIRRNRYELGIKELGGKMEYVYLHTKVTDGDK